MMQGKARQGKVRQVHCGARLTMFVHVSHSLALRLAGGSPRLTSCLACEVKVRLACHEASQVGRVTSILASWPSLLGSFIKYLWSVVHDGNLSVEISAGSFLRMNA